jgi:hypothetical protein
MITMFLVKALDDRMFPLRIAPTIRRLKQLHEMQYEIRQVS